MPPNLYDPSLYTNRELSLLAFHRRVLAQARDPQVPLLERLRFLTIASTNLDELFEVRVAGLLEQERLGVAAITTDGLSPIEALSAISADAHELVAEQYQALNDEILPSLESEGIALRPAESWTLAQARWVKRYSCSRSSRRSIAPTQRLRSSRR